MYQAEPSLRREVLAADATPEARVDFIRKTYLHLGGAVLAFIALEAFFLRTPAIYEPLTRFAFGGRWNWLIVIGAFMLVGYVAQSWAANSRSMGMQYAGLLLYVLVEAVIFVPLLYIVTYFAQFEGILTQAAMITAIVFGGMTAIVFLTKKDFSFMGPFLGVAMMAAFGIGVASLIFGFSMGIVYSAAVAVLAAGYILYYTSNVLHKYPIGSHVAAALQLFAAIALLFWYVVRILMASRR
jgi:FtsH-binding integral membrane protein